MLKKLVNEAHFTLAIITKGPVLVRSGHATLIGPDMTPVLTFRNGEQQVYLPGSSLKGVIRSHLEKVSRTLQENAVCDPFQKPPAANAFCGLKFQQRKKNSNNQEEISSETAYQESCPICRLFGSTEFIGRISINDAYLADGIRAQPTEVRDGVGIDRLTGGAAHGPKFELETVSSGIEFHTDIHLRNFECWQLGMLLLAVQDMADGLIRIGSGRSRGLGSVEGKVSKLHINHIGRVNGKPAEQVWGLGCFLNDGSYGTQQDDILTLSQAPVETRRGIRLQAAFHNESLADLEEKAVAAFVNRLQSWQMPDTMQLAA